MKRRTLVTFAGASVEIFECDDAATQLVRFLFGRFEPGVASVPRVSLELASDGTSTYILHRHGSLVYRQTPAATAARLLQAEVMNHLASGYTAGPLFHAAAVAGDTGGILLPGASGSGKSTLSAYLNDVGFHALGDELIGVSGDGAALVSFPRPICLDPDAGEALPTIVEVARRDGRLLEDDGGFLLAPRSAVHTAPLMRLAFPLHVPGRSTELRALSKADAGLRLMGLLHNASTAPDHRFAQIGALVRRVPAFELIHDDLRSVGSIVVS